MPYVLLPVAVCASVPPPTLTRRRCSIRCRRSASAATVPRMHARAFAIERTAILNHPAVASAAATGSCGGLVSQPAHASDIHLFKRVCRTPVCVRKVLCTLAFAIHLTHWKITSYAVALSIKQLYRGPCEYFVTKTPRHKIDVLIRSRTKKKKQLAIGATQCQPLHVASSVAK